MQTQNQTSPFKKENIRLLRQHLHLTQEGFITQFFTSENGQAVMSVATLSNLEAKGGKRITEVVQTLSKNLELDETVFSMEPELFADKIGAFLPKTTDSDEWSHNGKKKGGIDQLIYRLTMYFSEQIFNDALKKGDKIESDRVLANKMKVGRSAIREALKVLEVLGMIDIRPGQGSYISNDESNFFIIPLSWSLFLNGSQVDSILDVRDVLEIQAAELAAACNDDDLKHELYDISHQISKAYVSRNFDEFLEKDLEFHLCIAKCSQNQVIVSILQTISNLMRHVSGTGMATEEQLKTIYEEHHVINGLILAGDGKGAAQAMRVHLQNSKERYDLKGASL